MSALVSLSTTFFPGWPTAEPLSTLQFFMLCFGAPIIIGALFMGIGVGFGRRHEASAEQRAAGLGPQTAAREVVTTRPQRALVEDETGAHSAH